MNEPLEQVHAHSEWLTAIQVAPDCAALLFDRIADDSANNRWRKVFAGGRWLSLKVLRRV